MFQTFEWLGAFYVLSWSRVESASAQAPPAPHDLVTIIAIAIEIDYAEAEAFRAERSVRSPHRLVSPQTDETARALVSPSENRVNLRSGITVSATPCVRADPGQPLALAKANPAVRLVDSLDRYGILESGSAAQCCRPPFNSMVYWVSFK